MDEDSANRSALMAGSLLLPLLTELLGALHDEGVLTAPQTARVVERWDAALASWEKREGMRTTASIMRADLNAETAHRLPVSPPASSPKPTRLKRLPRR